MARVVLPESSIKARRRRRRAIILWGSGLLVLVMCGVLVWLANASFLRITAVTVSEVKTVAAAAIEGEVQNEIKGYYFNIFRKDNIFLYPKERIKQKILAGHSTLKHVEVRAENFSTIHISALDREPRALWCGEHIATSTSCLLLDEDGIAYAEAPEFSDNPYKKYFGGVPGQQWPWQFLDSNFFRSLAALVDAIAQHQAGEKIASVLVDSKGDVRLSFENSFTLLFVLKDDGGEVFERFTLALTAEPFKNHTLTEFEYLDLRFGDKLYYKLRSEE